MHAPEQVALRRIQWALEQYLKEARQPTKKEFILKAKARRVLNILSVQVAIEEALAKLEKK
jgi:preprotein translocase subunit Sss1